MNSVMFKSAVVGLTSLALAGGLTACGGGGMTNPAVTAGAGAPSVGVPLGAGYGRTFSLGLVAADVRTIAGLRQIRHIASVTPLPASIDLSPRTPPVGDQGQEGSCVSWASAYALRGYEARQDVWSAVAPKTADPTRNFSPAFVYNQVNGGKDGGSTIPSALSLLQTKGAATLADMPYVSGQFTTQPSAAAFADAANYKLSSFGYIAPTDLTSIKTQLANGLPVILAIKVYNNFFALGPNQVYSTLSGGYAGGHAIAAVGYDDAKQAVLVQNSWGTRWATGGYGWIAYTTLSQMALEAYSAVDDRGLPPKPGSTPAPKATPTPLPTVKPTAVPTAKPTATPTPKATASPAPKPIPTPTSTAKPTPVPSATPKTGH